MRIYVAGCGGMLGEAVHKVLAEHHTLKCTDIDLNAPWLELCDFRDYAAYKASVESFAPEVLIHLGAHTDLEYCELNPDDAYRTNTLSVEHAATLAQAHGIPLVYISTAGIFDGQKLLYDDWDQPNPLGVYARSKYLGEHIVEKRVAKHFIFRAGWMMGGGPAKDKKFIAKMMKQLAAGAKVLNVVDDKLGTPTYTVDFARNINAMLGTEYYGLYNMVCGGETGRYEVAKELVDVLGLSDTVEVKAVNSDFFSKEYFAQRPPSERLVNYKLDLRGLNGMQDWKIALRQYIRDYYREYVAPFAPNYTP
ncbi:sugar nucleotide-binding protein [uncultured Caulobacter sp.]|jgi:dTDP-4-dehydrorhamnose reductase|uniref:SDR family oxidoreductase n=1 Tax=uncultured Caulobacter sp. TaxID=158749 RepID=UPI00260273A9|nr:sugar nucleotide-binding protein [uncultured Caulobacter sp.]